MVCSEEIMTYLMKAYDDGVPLHSILSPHHLKTLIVHPDSEVRMWLAKCMVHDDDHADILKYLIPLAKDRDELVRLEAIDTLSSFISQESIHTLYLALEDSEALVRAYAAYGIAVVGSVICLEEATQVLKKAKAHEQSLRVQADIYYGLWLLGETVALDCLIGLFDCKDYQVQCAVLRSLTELLDTQNNEKVHLFLSSLQPDDYPLPVADILRQWLAEQL